MTFTVQKQLIAAVIAVTLYTVVWYDVRVSYEGNYVDSLNGDQFIPWSNA